MVRRITFWWFTGRDRNKPSGRDWARQLGISHTWLQRLVREFKQDPDEMWALQRSEGNPKLADLSLARECTQRMRQRGELHLSRRAKWEKFLKYHPRPTD